MPGQTNKGQNQTNTNDSHQGSRPQGISRTQGVDFRPPPSFGGGADPALEWLARRERNSGTGASGLAYDPRFLNGVYRPSPAELEQASMHRDQMAKAGIEDQPKSKDIAKVEWLKQNGYL